MTFPRFALDLLPGNDVHPRRPFSGAAHTDALDRDEPFMARQDRDRMLARVCALEFKSSWGRRPHKQYRQQFH
jgi:hypothetical protein